MVLMPSQITVNILSRQTTAGGDAVRFEVRNSEGALAVSNGLVELRA
jgi:hypothetical protein